MADISSSGKEPVTNGPTDDTGMPPAGARKNNNRNPARNAILASAWLLGLLILGLVLIYGQGVLIPLAVAILIWHMINAIANRFQAIRVGGTQMPGWLSLVCSLATIVIALWLVVDIVSGNVAQVGAAAPIYQENLSKLAASLPSWVGNEALPSVEELVARINIPTIIGTLTASLGALIGNTGLVAIYVMFLLLEQASFDRKIDALFPDSSKSTRIRAVLDATEKRIERYLWIKTLMSLLTATLCYVVLAVVGVDYPGFWALIVFLFNYIPNIGSGIAVLLPCVLALLQFGSITTTLVLAFALSGIQFVVGSVIEPRFMGTSLNLSPLVIMLSLTLWGSIWGLAGMVLCVPMTVILAIFCSHFKATQPIAVILSSDGKIR